MRSYALTYGAERVVCRLLEGVVQAAIQFLCQRERHASVLPGRSDQLPVVDAEKARGGQSLRVDVQRAAHEERNPENV